ncbi:hypothetical protein AGOR_G00030490 [Albula goreensis]|uniref:GLTSCR protein conserved domain-containing protein n=1 Tax=Albula goreensis TaxID=1534307 RepID=A0A8T3E9Q7_9TELE|nr:hypothetical protein AGOR_G00030490 [Albula goreensis]
METRAGLCRRPRATCTSIVSVDMDDEDGRCLLDVICDPQALNDFLHGSETHLDTDDLLDGSTDPSSSFFSGAGGHVSEVQTSSQLPSIPAGVVPSTSVDLDFLEDDDILGGGPGSPGGAVGEPCDILQQSLAEANITAQSLQEAEAELDLGPFGIPGLGQVVQSLPDSSALTGAGGSAVGVGIGVGGSTQIFPAPAAAPGSTVTPPAGGAAPTDVIGSVLAHPGLQLQSQVVNKAISVQPFMQQMGLGNVTLQPISGLQALPNGSQSGHLGIGQIQVVGQPTVMTINQSGQPILAAKTMGGYQLHQPGPDQTGAAMGQARLGAPVLSSAGAGGLLIQGGKAALGSPALNGAVVSMSSASTSSSSSAVSSTLTAPGGLLGFGGAAIGPNMAPQQKALAQAPLMQNVIIQRTPTPIQPKPPQGGVIHPRPPAAVAASALQNDAAKAMGIQQGSQIPVSSAAQNVAFLTGKPGGNMVLSTTQAGPQGAPATAFSQALFKQQPPPQGTGKSLSVHLLNQPGSIVIPSPTVLQGQNHQFLLPQLQTAGGQILTQAPGGHHIITSQGPGGQIIANQILAATNQNLNLGQVLAPQGHSGTAHILSGHIQLQPGGQIGAPALFQVPVSLAQTQTQAGQAQTVIQGMPLQNSLTMLGQVEGLGPATVSLQPPPQQPAGGVPGNGPTSSLSGQCPPSGEGVAVLGSATDQAARPAQPSILTIQTSSSSISVPTSSLSSSPASSSSSLSSSGAPITTALPLQPPQAQHSPGKLLLTPQGAAGMILSQESLQMFLQQIPGHQQQAKVLGASPSHPLPSTLHQTESPQPCQASPLILGQQIQSPHHQRPPSEPPPPSQAPPQPQTQPQPLARSATPSAMPPLFIIHNQIGGSPQHMPQTQPQSRPPSQPAPFPPEPRPSSCSPKPPQAPPLPGQFQFAAPPTTSSSSSAPTPPPSGPGPKAQQGPSVLSLTLEQQHTLALVSAQLHTLSSIPQPSPQQKQLLDRLHQVQHSIILQAKQQAQTQTQTQIQTQMQPLTLAPNQFSPQQDPPTAPIVTSSASTSLLHQTSVLVKTPAPVSNEVKAFSVAPATAVPTVKPAVTPVSLAQPVQAKQGVISSVGGLSVPKGGLQVVGAGLCQMGSPQPPPAPAQTQTATLKMPFPMKPSKEARMLEQLRKQQGSALHPDYSSPFRSYGDALQRLIPYHLYQGTPCSPQDYRRVDEEFESASSQLLKRTQVMLDKYRLLLFEESKQRLGPSAEMVMIDRMFIQEEKLALNQDKILAKERPDEYVALRNATVCSQPPSSAEAGPVKPVSTSATGSLTAAPAPAAVPSATPSPAHYTPTKLVIKQGGGGASVSWSTSTSSTPGPTTPRVGLAAAQAAPPPSSAPAFSRPRFRDNGGGGEEDEDALPQRSSRPPMKTYEARRRIGLKLKIKQEAGFSKVVHNTALDPVHSAQPPTPTSAQTPQRSDLQHQQPLPSVPKATTAATSRTPPRGPESASAVARATGPAIQQQQRALGASSTPSSSSSAQMNGTLEHHEPGWGGAKQNPAPTQAPPPTVSSTPTSCRLPLRKTYRANISPPVRPGVAGGGRTVIASVKVENRGGKGHSHTHANANTNTNPGVGGGNTNATANTRGSPPGLMQELAEVEEAFYRGMVKNRHPPPPSRGGEVELALANEEEEGGKNRERSSSGAPPSPSGSSCSWDSLLPAKRLKSDSPAADVDNASFSSGSPPPDDSLNEHLQSAIDSILNLQQGVGQGSIPAHQRQGQGAPYRPAAPSSVAASSQRLQTGGAVGGEFSSARGQNGKLVSRTHSR